MEKPKALSGSRSRSMLLGRSCTKEGIDDLRRLRAVDTLGADTVICTDKTDTLATNVFVAIDAVKGIRRLVQNWEPRGA